MTDRTDTFNRADSITTLGTPSDAGSAWVPVSGTWGITLNQGYKQATDATFQAAYLESSVTAVDAQVTFVTNGSGGLAGRLADDANYLFAQWDGASSYFIFKKVANSFTQLGTIGGTLSVNDVLKLRMDSSNLLTFSQNGTSRVTATDAAGSTNTKHGLASFTGGGGGLIFDNFSITALVATDGSLMGQSRQQFAMGLGA